MARGLAALKSPLSIARTSNGRIEISFRARSGLERNPFEPYIAAVPNAFLMYPHPAYALLKEQPKGDHRLVLVSQGTDFDEHSVEGVVVDYLLAGPGSPPAPMANVAWTDWDMSGRLLVATLDGGLQIREYGAEGWSTVWSADLNSMKPHQTKSPEWARAW